jgi:hypothetical protein
MRCGSMTGREQRTQAYFDWLQSASTDCDGQDGAFLAGWEAAIMSEGVQGLVKAAARFKNQPSLDKAIDALDRQERT